MSDDTQRHIRKHIAALCTRIGSRMIGTPGDHASAEYVEAHFRRLGLKTLDNAMPCVGWDLESTSLRVDGRPFRAIGNMYSPAGRAVAPLVLAEADMPAGEFAALKGKAVGVYGNFVPFPDRLNGFARRAEKAGAACVIVIDSDPTTSATKLVRDLSLKSMPAVSVSLETGFRLAKLEGKWVECTVKARRYKSVTRDVIGVLGSGEREICIEAHRDSAPDTPAADDNGSGSAVLLELARLLALSTHRHAIRFVSATAEEFGDVGTPVYAKRFAKDLPRIDLMVNIDCVGGALCPVKVYVPRNDSLMPLAKKLVTPYRTLRVVPAEPRAWGHIIAYLRPGTNEIAVVSEWANARIHTPRDEPASLSPAKMADTAFFLRDLIEAYDKKPPRGAPYAYRPIRPTSSRANR